MSQLSPRTPLKMTLGMAAPLDVAYRLQAETLEQAFPTVDPGVLPFGQRVLVQIRRPRTVSAGGVTLPDEARETIKWATQVAKVIALGPLAFKNRTTQEPWPEGQWTQVGDFVRVPKYGGDKWEVAVPGAAAGYENAALFVIFNDLDLIGKVTVDPLSIKAYV